MNNQSDRFNAALRSCDEALRKLGLSELIEPSSLLPRVALIEEDDDESEES